MPTSVEKWVTRQLITNAFVKLFFSVKKRLVDEKSSTNCWNFNNFRDNISYINISNESNE